MDKVVHKVLSYKITALLFKAHTALGRFKSEKQYADFFEELLKKEKIKYEREFRFINTQNKNKPARCICDFIIEDKIILEFKTKSFITKEDYFQTKRYLVSLDKQLAFIVNFRQYRLYPKRVLNKEYLKNLNEFEDSNYNISQPVEQNNSGSALLMTILILSSIMVVALNAASLVMSGVILSGTQERSTLAFYAAEAGAERSLWEARKNPGFTMPDSAQTNIFGTTTLSNGAYNLVDFSSSTPDVFFSSEGNYAETKRKVELKF